ncbi:hypothetical protein GCM10027427_21230 [Pseudoclavibacter terrae]
MLETTLICTVLVTSVAPETVAAESVNARKNGVPTFGLGVAVVVQAAGASFGFDPSVVVQPEVPVPLACGICVGAQDTTWEAAAAGAMEATATTGAAQAPAVRSVLREVTWVSCTERFHSEEQPEVQPSWDESP